MSYQNPILEVNKLIKFFYFWSNHFFWRFQTVKVIDNITFNLFENEILGIIGPNGSGKTTLFHLLLGILKPTSGDIYYFSKNFSKHRSDILERVSFASSHSNMPPDLTVFENLDIYGRLYGLNKEDRLNKINEYLNFFDLHPVRNRKMGSLSSGMISCILLIKAFLPNSKVIILDEPTEYLDDVTSDRLVKFILEQQILNNHSIIIALHENKKISDLCTRTLVLQNGKIVKEKIYNKNRDSVVIEKEI